MVFSEIMEKMNIDEDELSEEFNRRVKILEWMRKKNITEFRDIAKILFMYTRDPDKIMEVVESG